MPFAENLQSLLGLFVLTGFAAALAPRDGHRLRSGQLKTAVAGLLVQLVIALVILKLPVARHFFLVLNEIVAAIQAATDAGTSFVFGYLGGGPLPFEEMQTGTSFIFAFRALPLILIMSALSSLLFYWRILPLLVRGFSSALQKTLGIGRGPRGRRCRQCICWHGRSTRTDKALHGAP